MLYLPTKFKKVRPKLMLMASYVKPHAEMHKMVIWIYLVPFQRYDRHEHPDILSSHSVDKKCGYELRDELGVVEKRMKFYIHL